MMLRNRALLKTGSDVMAIYKVATLTQVVTKYNLLEITVYLRIHILPKLHSAHTTDTPPTY